MLINRKKGFFKSKAVTHKNGALLIFDETITGFRYAKGGAQELFGVIPDIATFGKELAIGFFGGGSHHRFGQHCFFKKPEPEMYLDTAFVFSKVSPAVLG